MKFSLHNKLLNRVNLEALSSISGEKARGEIRAAVARLVDEEKTPLSPGGKRPRHRRSPGRSLRSRPARAAAAGPRHLRHPGHHAAPGLRGKGGKLHRTPVEFKDNAHLLRIIEKVVSRVGRRVDESSPLVDARLPDGSRVNAAIPPVAVDGPLLSIRRFGRHALKGEELVAKLALTEGMLELLKGRCGRA